MGHVRKQGNGVLCGFNSNVRIVLGHHRRRPDGQEMGGGGHRPPLRIHRLPGALPPDRRLRVSLRRDRPAQVGRGQSAGLPAHLLQRATDSSTQRPAPSSVKSWRRSGSRSRHNYTSREMRFMGRSRSESRLAPCFLGFDVFSRSKILLNILLLTQQNTAIHRPSSGKSVEVYIKKKTRIALGFFVILACF